MIVNVTAYQDSSDSNIKTVVSYKLDRTTLSSGGDSYVLNAITRSSIYSTELSQLIASASHGSTSLTWTETKTYMPSASDSQGILGTSTTGITNTGTAPSGVTSNPSNRVLFGDGSWRYPNPYVASFNFDEDGHHLVASFVMPDDYRSVNAGVQLAVTWRDKSSKHGSGILSIQFSVGSDFSGVPTGCVLVTSGRNIDATLPTEIYFAIREFGSHDYRLVVYSKSNCAVSFSLLSGNVEDFQIHGGGLETGQSYTKFGFAVPTVTSYNPS